MLILCAILIILPAVTIASEGSLQLTGNNDRSFIAYSVDKSSWLSLSGTTNVNSFECLSSNGVSKGYILAEVKPDDDRINFTDARILVKVNSFDCKNPLISRDMYKALGGDQNPYIEIKLLDAKPGDEYLYSTTGNFNANVVITINGKSRTTVLNIDWSRKEGFEYHFEGSADLTMSDFGIVPPSPVMGMIRLDDNITVNFNYIVQTSIISLLD